jgi:uncharacterized repeat protein (TIGR03803 family)
MNTDGTGYTVLKHCTWSGGWGAYAGLTLSGSTLYGTTAHGDSSGNGTVFKVNTDGTSYTVLKDFTDYMANPQAGLTLSGSTLYGTTSGGGSSGVGTVFKVNTDGTGYTVLKHCTSSDGAGPQAVLALSGSTLYGTTSGGGSSGYGTLFKVNTDGTGYTVLKHCTSSDGANPRAGLTLSGSTLYGTTSGGGSSGYGTVFKVNTDGTGYAVLTHFSGSDGAYPCAGLTLSGSTLYGTTSGGGSLGNGTVFKLELVKLELVLHGIDVSHYQNEAGPITWSDVYNIGQKRFVFVKASEATDTPDGIDSAHDFFQRNIQWATAACLLASPYHLARPDRGTTAIAEAQYFLSRAGNCIADGYLPPTLDIEPNRLGSLTWSQVSQWARTWLQYVQQQKPGVTPILYTTRGVLRNLDNDLLEYPLWIATDDQDEIGIPCYMGTCWNTWKFKQYLFGEHGGNCAGVTGPVDLNSFNGDVSELNQLVIRTRFTGVGSGRLQPPSNGQFQFEVHSVEQQVTIQASDDMLGWTDVGIVNLVNGQAVFTDSNAGTHSNRFYRRKP